MQVVWRICIHTKHTKDDGFCSLRASKAVKNLHTHTHTQDADFGVWKAAKKLCQEFAYTKHTQTRVMSVKLKSCKICVKTQILHTQDDDFGGVWKAVKSCVKNLHTHPRHKDTKDFVCVLKSWSWKAAKKFV